MVALGYVGVVDTTQRVQKNVTVLEASAVREAAVSSGEMNKSGRWKDAFLIDVSMMRSIGIRLCVHRHSARWIGEFIPRDGYRYLVGIPTRALVGILLLSLLLTWKGSGDVRCVDVIPTAAS